MQLLHIHSQLLVAALVHLCFSSGTHTLCNAWADAVLLINGRHHALQTASNLFIYVIIILILIIIIIKAICLCTVLFLFIRSHTMHSVLLLVNPAVHDTLSSTLPTLLLLPPLALSGSSESLAVIHTVVGGSFS